ncbi:hypothetical protein RCL_jg28285.t1 [Rhizophagus clarus]|uniref:Uncharacterized protein n=1 Tax=Rhizophagus clarus TaxID=94130 RepID=A0A8H3LXF9_9GLOM|nr:hypothetical protein RCL_jg28285.t1 [Rhizophagus clarus]
MNLHNYVGQNLRLLLLNQKENALTLYLSQIHNIQISVKSTIYKTKKTQGIAGKITGENEISEDFLDGGKRCFYWKTFEIITDAKKWYFMEFSLVNEEKPLFKLSDMAPRVWKAKLLAEIDELRKKVAENELRSYWWIRKMDFSLPEEPIPEVLPANVPDSDIAQLEQCKPVCDVVSKVPINSE